VTRQTSKRAGAASPDLRRLDNMLEAVMLFRLSETGRARDLGNDLVTRADGQGTKLDAFSLGIFDAMLRARGASRVTLPLLVYMLKLSEHGPGPETVDAADRAIGFVGDAGMGRYVELGRYAAIKTLDGRPTTRGGYAEALLIDLTGY
jgi:hypothetical protein